MPLASNALMLTFSWSLLPQSRGRHNLHTCTKLSKEILEALNCINLRGLVSEETVVLRRWGSDTRKFGLSMELIM